MSLHQLRERCYLRSGQQIAFSPRTRSNIPEKSNGGVSTAALKALHIQFGDPEEPGKEARDSTCGMNNPRASPMPELTKKRRLDASAPGARHSKRARTLGAFAWRYNGDTGTTAAAAAATAAAVGAIATFAGASAAAGAAVAVIAAATVLAAIAVSVGQSRDVMTPRPVHSDGGDTSPVSVVAAMGSDTFAGDDGNKPPIAKFPKKKYRRSAPTRSATAFTSASATPSTTAWCSRTSQAARRSSLSRGHQVRLLSYCCCLCSPIVTVVLNFPL